MYYGFDVGGTKIEFGAFNKNLERVASERISTPVDNYNNLVDVICDLINIHDKIFGISGSIGIGLPGVENAETGVIMTANIPSANGRKLRSDLQFKLGRKVKIENDANCFALSEAMDDKLKNIPLVMGLILGTGFGSGLIYKGQVLSGRNHVSGEIGHTRLPIDAWFYLDSTKDLLLNCGCGKQGCLDNYLSGRGFELIYEYYFGQRKSAIDIINLYYSGDNSAMEHVDRFLEILAICLGNILTIYDPDVIVMGGGLSNFNIIYQELPKRIQKYLLTISKCPRIVKAKFGDSGGVRGAAFLNI